MSEKTKEENINLAVSPDGNYIGVSTVKDELSFYDLRNLKLIKQIKYNKVDINGFQWSKLSSPTQGDHLGLTLSSQSTVDKLLFVPDQNGSVSIYNGETFNPIPLHVMNDCHNGNCYALAVDPKNRYFVTGGTDSLIGIWDMSDFNLIKTISNNDARVIAVSINFDGTLIASICEDDINKKYLIEVYDFNYDDPSSTSGG